MVVQQQHQRHHRATPEGEAADDDDNYNGDGDGDEDGDEDEDEDEDDDNSLRRKRQRVQTNSNVNVNSNININADDGGLDCNQTAAAAASDNAAMNRNHYKGWVVPESNYQIPILRVGNNNNNNNNTNDELKPENFYQNYVRRRRPVVIRGAKLPAELEHLQKWSASNDDMLQNAGDEIVTVEQRSSQTDSFGKGEEVSMPVRRFLSLIEDESDTMHYLTTQDVEANDDGRPELMSPFMKKLYSNSNSRCNNSDNSNSNGNGNGCFPLQPAITGNLVPQNINLWIGNSSNSNIPDKGATSVSVSSGLHHDYHDNLYIVLRGTKRFRLFSPADTHNMYTRGILHTIHTNGRINYQGEVTTAYGADLGSYEAAQAHASKEDAEQRLEAAEQAVAEGKPGAHAQLERAEALLDAAMEAILDAETNDDDNDDENYNDESDDDEESFCLETATEENVAGLLETSNFDPPPPVSSSSKTGDIDDFDDLENTTNAARLVDKTVKNPNNFSKVEPSLLDDPSKLRSNNFPKILRAKAAFCECSSGDMLYLPASWFHEVTSSSSSSSLLSSDDNDGGRAKATTAKGHMAFNYWFHPPDAENNFEHPYTTDFWPNDFKDRFKDTKQNETKRNK